MLRKSVVVFTVFAFIFGMAGLALAANRVEVKVTSEPIPQGASCSKAGGFSLEFDEGTALVVGDQITADTDFGTTICKSFDFIIAPAGDVVLNPDGTYFAGTLWGDPAVVATNVLPYANGTAAFTQTVAGTVTGSTGVVFRVRGIAGTQRITIDVLGPAGNTLVVTNADINQADVVTLNFLDEKTNPLAVGPSDPNPAGPEQWVNESLWEVDTPATVPPVANGKVFDDDADWNDNTLCIDASNPTFTKTVVNASMDSRNDKYTFIPSNPQIAHIANPLNIVQYPCKGAAASNIRIPDDQGACIMDYEAGTGYCTAGDLGRRVVLHNVDNFFDNTKSYQVRLDVISPTDRIYWNSGAVNYEIQINPTCTTGAGVAAGTFPAGRAWNVNGTELTTFVGGGASCTIVDAQKATSIETAVVPNLFGGIDRKGIWIDLPNLVFETGIPEGTEVRVRITLQAYPCGTVYTGEVSLGVFGCAIAVVPNTLIYPYFTATQAAWWNGIVIDNLAATTATVTAYMYEADGDQATLTTEIPANSSMVELLPNLLPLMTMTASPDGELGNSQSYIVVCSSNTLDGFAMIARETDDVNGSESMGYLPRYNRPLAVCNP